MALNLGQSLSSMGIIAGRQREAERADWAARAEQLRLQALNREEDRKSTRLNSSH